MSYNHSASVSQVLNGHLIVLNCTRTGNSDGCMQVFYFWAQTKI